MWAVRAVRICVELFVLVPERYSAHIFAAILINYLYFMYISHKTLHIFVRYVPAPSTFIIHEFDEPKYEGLLQYFLVSNLVFSWNVELWLRNATVKANAKKKQQQCKPNICCFIISPTSNNGYGGQAVAIVRHSWLHEYEHFIDKNYYLNMSDKFLWNFWHEGIQSIRLGTQTIWNNLLPEVCCYC